MIRENIKRICKEKGRTISDLEHGINANGGNISKGYIYNMKNPTYEMMKQIADELGVEVCELIGGE